MPRRLIEYMDYGEIKKRRKHFLTHSKKVTRIRKGDRRLTDNCYCSLCGQSLAVYMPSKSEVRSIRDFSRCYFDNNFYVNICKRADSCKRVIEKYKGVNTQ